MKSTFLVLLALIASANSVGMPAPTTEKTFIKIETDKYKIYELEAFVLTFKVYSLLDLSELEDEIPDMKGFYTKEIEQPSVKLFNNEIINGKKYRYAIWKQFMMFAQTAGDLIIPSFQIKGTVIHENRSNDPIDDFFNNRDKFETEQVTINSPEFTVHVEKLPSPPISFTGGVGVFQISSSLIRKDSTRCGNPITLRVIVEGKGNMNLMRQPNVYFSDAFELYDVRQIDSTKLTSNGYEGRMIFDYPVVPLKHGTLMIPPVTFTYFNTDKEEYETIETKEQTIVVEREKASETQKGSKISHIIEDGLPHHSHYAKLIIWASLTLFVLVTVILIIFFRKRKKAKVEQERKKSERAHLIAVQRLNKAYMMMVDNRHEEFYDEVLHTLWDYVAEKMRIPVEKLTKENISANMHRIAASNEVTTMFINTLNECEFEHYAPGTTSGNMQDTYQSVLSVIQHIELVALVPL